MKTKKAFTLIELLVVISIIALLLAIIMPALNTAKEQARRIKCTALLKSYGKANHLYASANGGYFVPFSQPHADTSLSWDERWCENKEYRKNISVEERVEIEDSGWNDAFVWPKELRCPSQKIPDIDIYTENTMNNGSQGWMVIMSFGYNVEHWRGSGNLRQPTTWWPSGVYYGHHQASIKKPSEKMMFIDNNYYQARYERANPEKYWEKYGDRILAQENMGQVCYRHLGNADMVFFDGHAASLKADEVYDKDNPVLSAGNVKNRRPNLLWDVGSTSDLTGSKK